MVHFISSNTVPVNVFKKSLRFLEESGEFEILSEIELKLRCVVT